MTSRIIYKGDDEIVKIIIPSPEFLAGYGSELKAMDILAKRRVPSGKPYKIIDVSEIPSDRSMRNAWTVDENDLTDGVGK